MSGSEPYPDLSDIPCGLDIRLNSSLIINQSNLKHLNKRTLLSRLGRGGYGTVYLAENRAISRVSALKVCNRQLASGSSRSKESKCTSFDAEADAYFYVQTQDLPKVGIPLCYGTGEEDACCASQYSFTVVVHSVGTALRAEQMSN